MIERREFLKKMALLAGVMGGGALLAASGKAADQEIGIAVVEGENPNAQVQEAIRLLGGIQRFVRRGDRVVLLPNPQGTGRGSPPTRIWWLKLFGFVWRPAPPR